MAIAKCTRLRRRLVLGATVAAVVLCAWIAVSTVGLRGHSRAATDGTANDHGERGWRWSRLLGGRVHSRMPSGGEPMGVAGSDSFYARAPEYWIDVVEPPAAAAAVSQRQQPPPLQRLEPETDGGRPADDGEARALPEPYGDCPRSEQRCGGTASESDVGCAAAAFADLEMAPANDGCAAASAAAVAADRGGLAIIVVLRDREDSVPVQTFLSAHAFTPAHALSEVLFALPGDAGSDGNATAAASRKRWLTAADRLLQAYGCTGGRAGARRLVTGRTVFDAVVAAARLSHSRYLAVAADSIVFAPGWAEPLLDAARSSARAVFLPHVDALLPNLVYRAPYGRQAYSEPKSSVWTVGWSLRYRELLAPGRAAAGEWLASAALPSDAYFVSREFLLETVATTAADPGRSLASAFDLGYAAWTCGGGVFLVGCSTVLKASNYFHAAGNEEDAEEGRDSFAAAHMGAYEQLYWAAAEDAPVRAAQHERRWRRRQQSGRQPAPVEGCRDFRWYAEEVARLPLTRLSPNDIDKVKQLGSLASLFSGRCFRFDDSAETVVAVELDSCLTDSATTFFVQHTGGGDRVGPLRRAGDGACLVCSSPNCGSLQSLRIDGSGGDDSRCLRLTGDGLLSDDHGCCLIRREVASGDETAASAAAENCSSILSTTSRHGERTSISAWTWTLVP